VDFLLVLMELFSLGVTANIGSKSAISPQRSVPEKCTLQVNVEGLFVVGNSLTRGRGDGPPRVTPQ